MFKIKDLFCLIVLAVLIVGCFKKKQVSASHKNMVHINFGYSPITIDPRKTTDPVSSTLHFMLYEGLMRLEPDGSLSFAVAKDLIISKDKKVYTFLLKKTFWSDGSPVTAYDFERSWKSALSPDFPSPSSHLFFPIKNASDAKLGNCSLNDVGIKAVDDYTLVVHLEHPTNYFTDLTAFPTYFPFPSHNENYSLVNTEKSRLISNGPFILMSWKNEDAIVVKKNFCFWNMKNVKIDGIHMSIITDESTAFQLFEKGEFDWIGGLICPLPLDALSSSTISKNIKMCPIAGTNFCTFNTRHFPFDNVHIRKAFAFAMDRRSIVTHVTHMHDQVATSVIPGILKETKQDLKILESNAERAVWHFEKGLEELGLTRETFPALTYSFFSSELQRKVSQVLQAQWREILGVTVDLKCFELKVFLQKLHTRDYEFAQMSWIAQYCDQMSYLERFIKKDSFRNYSGWENALYQKLIHAGRTNLRKENRIRLLNQAETILINEMPIAPIYHYQSLYLTNPELKNIQMSPLGHVDFRYSFF